VVDDLAQRRARDIAHDDVRRLTPRVGVIDLRDPRRAHPTQRRHLAGEPRPAVPVTDDRGTQDLHSNAAVTWRFGEEDDPHPTLADLADQPVRAEGAGRLRG
jgi:hypothetical protein